jgi:GT2 family glycosyltransferase
MPDADVTIIVPAYIVDDSVHAMARSLLASLWDLPYVHEVYVIENGSERLANYGWNYFHYEQPLGYARATNIGLALAETKYLVVANVDLELPDGWLPRLLADYQQYGPGVLSADDTGRSGVWEESWFSLWMTDRATLAKVGYLDESLPFRVHDQDYAIRMCLAGFRVQRTGSVQVKHYEASTFNKMNIDWQAEADEMVRRYGHVHFRDWRAAGGGPR